MGKRPQCQAPTELTGPSGSSSASSHQDQLLPLLPSPSTQELLCVTQKEKLQESPNVLCGGLKCSSQGEIVVVVAGFNWDVQSLLSFYFTCASVAIPG